jgi:hypothetical protein
MTTYHGACHCGAVKFTVEFEIDRTVRCNCSLCRRRGAVMAYAEGDQLTLTEGEAHLREYRFHTGVARHYFCDTCGIYPFHRPRRFPDKFGVNVGCLEGVDPYAFEPELVQGADFD